MKYLITGITGFAGPHLAKLLLKEGHQVHGVVRTANGRETDLLDILTLEELESIQAQMLANVIAKMRKEAKIKKQEIIAVQ